jgi:iron complex transport system ATP-binding protein
MQAKPGEIVSLVGPNGSGKTTLLRCLVSILSPQSGHVHIHGQDIFRMSSKDRAQHMAYVPQNMPSKFPLTVFDMLLMGRRPYLGWRPSSTDLTVIENTLHSMQLDHLAMQDFDRLSGGQRQKVLIARAVVQQAQFMILDEPTSNLDLKHQVDVMRFLEHMALEHNTGIIVAIHDLNLAYRFAQQMILMQEGKVVCHGSPMQVLDPTIIEEVYQVGVRILSDNGHHFVIPEKNGF